MKIMTTSMYILALALVLGVGVGVYAQALMGACF